MLLARAADLSANGFSCWGSAALVISALIFRTVLDEVLKSTITAVRVRTTSLLRRLVVPDKRLLADKRTSGKPFFVCLGMGLDKTRPAGV